MNSRSIFKLFERRSEVLCLPEQGRLSALRPRGFAHGEKPHPWKWRRQQWQWRPRQSDPHNCSFSAAPPKNCIHWTVWLSLKDSPEKKTQIQTLENYPNGTVSCVVLVLCEAAQTIPLKAETNTEAGNNWCLHLFALTVWVSRTDQLVLDNNAINARTLRFLGRAAESRAA